MNNNFQELDINNLESINGGSFTATAILVGKVVIAAGGLYCAADSVYQGVRGFADGFNGK